MLCIDDVIALLDMMALQFVCGALGYFCATVITYHLYCKQEKHLLSALLSSDACEKRQSSRRNYIQAYGGKPDIFPDKSVGLTG